MVEYEKAVEPLHCRKRTYFPAGTLVGTTAIGVTSPVSGATGGVGTTGGYVEFDALVKCDGSNRSFTVQWTQNTAVVGNTTVLAGSYIEVCPA
jgi:hypothetical protein